MRDDRNRWPAALGPNRLDLEGSDVTVRLVQPDRQTVLSGPFPACMKLAGLSGEAAGSGDIVQADHYAVRQRRDRILVVGGPELEDGWNEDAGIAVSDLSSAYAVIEVSGGNAERIIATGTEHLQQAAGKSAARLWHGFTCLIYRHNRADTYRFHIRAAHLEAAWDMLERQIDLVGRLPAPTRNAPEKRFTSPEPEAELVNG